MIVFLRLRGGGVVSNVFGGSLDFGGLEKDVIFRGVKKVKDMIDFIPSGRGKDNSMGRLHYMDDRMGYWPGNLIGLDNVVQHFNNIVDLNIRELELMKLRVVLFGSDENEVENTAIANYYYNGSTFLSGEDLIFWIKH